MDSYEVVVRLRVDAKDPKDAAMKAYSLLNDETPRQFEVALGRAEDSLVDEVELTPEDAFDALQRAFKGTLFPSS